MVWKSCHTVAETSPKVQLLKRILDSRNSLVHHGKSFDLQTLGNIWTLPPKERSTQHCINSMLATLELVAGKRKQPEKLLLRSLYEWGLEVL
jgi:hypothetical protein